MARLPSASDVPTVTPRSDPGASVPSISVPNVRVPQKTAPSIRVPEGAFDSTLGIAAQELAPGVARLGEAFKQRDRRRAEVDRIEKEDVYGPSAAEELRRINTEADLSDDDVLQEYGKFLSSKRQELLQQHKGDEESLAVLDINLKRIEAEAIGRASAISTRLQYEKADAVYKGRLNPLLQSVAQDPTPENLDRNMLQLEDRIADLKGFFDPSQERDLVRIGREEIALSALDRLVISGRPEQAELLLDNHLSNELSPDNQRQVRSRIQTQIESRKREAREAVLNQSRILSPSEVRANFPSLPEGSIVQQGKEGISIKFTPSQDVNQNVLKIASLASALQKTGMDREEAFASARGYVNGQIEFQINPSTGQALILDAAKILSGDPSGVSELPIAQPELPPLKTKPRGTTGQGTTQPSAATPTATQPAAETQPTDVVSETTDDQQSSVALENLIQGGGIDASQAAGVMGLLRNITNKVVDAVGGGLPAGRNNLATNELIALQLATFGALREEIPGRENVMIDKLLEKATVSPNSPFTGKAGMLNKLKTLKSMVDQELQRIETDVLPLTLTQDMKQKVSINRTILNQQSINLGQVIDAFGKGDAELAKPINQMTLEELNSLDTDRLSDQQVQESETRARALSGVFEEGDTAVDPNTNERIIFKNGKWGTLNQ